MIFSIIPDIFDKRELFYFAGNLKASLGFRASSLYWRCLMPTFSTLAFQILAGNQAGEFAGFGTCLRSPLKKCSFLLPFSLSMMFLMSLLATFNAASLGCAPVNVPI